MCKNGPYWNVFFQNKLWLRSRHDRVIPYQCSATFVLSSECFLRGFARLTALCHRLKVPRGCSAELPPVLTYRMRELCYPVSPWCVVAYTEIAAKVAAYILLEVYDSCG